jgi:hypothetical protein
MLQQLLDMAVKANRKAHAEQGCHLISGSTTVTGNFYGFTLGLTAPTSLKITTNSNVILNGTALASTDEIISFVSPGEYVPIEFTSITITGSGYVKLWSK